MDVWAEFRQHFEFNDGSLPEVQLEDLGAAGVLSACRRLTEMGEFDAGFRGAWDVTENRSRDDLSFLESVQGVVEHRFESFHWTFSRVRVGGVELPELGVFVFDDAIYLNYRMGPAWTSATVTAFLELLELLLSVAPSSRLASGSSMLRPDAFMQSWTAFALERSSNKSRPA